MNMNSFYQLGRYLYLTYRVEDLAIQNNDNTIGHELFDLNGHYYDVGKRYLDSDVTINQPLSDVLETAMSRYAEAFRLMKSQNNQRRKNYTGTLNFIHGKAGKALLDVSETDLPDSPPNDEQMEELIQGYNQEVANHHDFLSGGTVSTPSNPTKTTTTATFVHQNDPEFEQISDLRKRAFLALYEMKEVLRRSDFTDQELMEKAGVDYGKSWARGNFTKAMMWLDDNDFIVYDHGNHDFDQASIHADVGNPYAYDDLVTVDTNLSRTEISALRVLYNEGTFLSQVNISSTELANKMGTTVGGHISDTMLRLEKANWIRRDETTSPYTYIPVQTRKLFWSEFGQTPSAKELSNPDVKVAALKSFFHETGRPQPSDNDLAEMIEEELDSVEASVSRLSQRGIVDGNNGDVLTPINLEGVSVPVSLDSLKDFV